MKGKQNRNEPGVREDRQRKSFYTTPCSLYLHIPFCVKKCIYCDFFSVPYDETLAPDYISAVVRELELRKGEAQELKTVYIGGGTPTVVPTTSLLRLLRGIKDSFRMSPGAEITIEANPGTITRESVLALADSGVNRMSVGVQSFDNAELKLLGRIHTFGDVIKALAAVRHSGIRNMSIDLIYGIPGQTMESWSRAVATARELSPEHISAYELTPEAHTPLYELIAQGKLNKPDEESIVAMYYHAIDGLASGGYKRYEISNFAKPGLECRHNMNYWNRGEYIGAGVAAHSFIGGRRIKNRNDIGEYIEAVRKGVLPVEESIEISCEDAIKEFIFLGLRKAEGLNITECREELGIDIVGAADELTEQGLLEVGEDHLKLTRKGIVVSNTVIAGLFQKLGL